MCPTTIFRVAFNDSLGHKKHKGLNSRLSLEEARDATIQSGKGLRNTINNSDSSLDIYKSENIGTFIFEHSERDGFFGELTTDFTFSNQLEGSTFYRDEIWNLQIGNAMTSNANISVGLNWRGGIRSDIKSIIINSGSSPITSSYLNEFSLKFNNIPVYNTIGNTTYRIQSSGTSGFGSCTVYSGENGGYCN